MKIEKINIEKLKKYENNAKLHPQNQIDKIKESIKNFGNNDPICIDENDVIIAGHGRYEALVQLGYKEIEIIRLSHLTNEQKKAYSLVHNKLTLNSNFDTELLKIELNEIKDIDMGFYDFFEIEDIDWDEKLLREYDEPAGGNKKIKICPHCKEEI